MEICKFNQPSVVTPPRWKMLIFWVILSVVVAQLVGGGIHDTDDLISLVMLAVCAAGVFVSGVHYKFAQAGFIVCFLWIPLRRIGWQRVTHALFAHAWKDTKPRYSRIANPGPVTGQILYVTIDHCPKWDPKAMRQNHNLSHPFRAFTIWLPYQQKHYFVETFKKYYPALETQPK